MRKRNPKRLSAMLTKTGSTSTKPPQPVDNKHRSKGDCTDDDEASTGSPSRINRTKDEKNKEHSSPTRSEEETTSDKTEDDDHAAEHKDPPQARRSKRERRPSLKLNPDGLPALRGEKSKETATSPGLKRLRDRTPPQHHRGDGESGASKAAAAGASKKKRKTTRPQKFSALTPEKKGGSIKRTPTNTARCEPGGGHDSDGNGGSSPRKRLFPTPPGGNVYRQPLTGTPSDLKDGDEKGNTGNGSASASAQTSAKPSQPKTKLYDVKFTTPLGIQVVPDCAMETCSTKYNNIKVEFRDMLSALRRSEATVANLNALLHSLQKEVKDTTLDNEALEGKNGNLLAENRRLASKVQKATRIANSTSRKKKRKDKNNGDSDTSDDDDELVRASRSRGKPTSTLRDNLLMISTAREKDVTYASVLVKVSLNSYASRIVSDVLELLPAQNGSVSFFPYKRGF